MKKVSILLALIMLCGMFLPLFSVKVRADGLIRLVPSTEVVRWGQQFEVDICAENMDDLYGLEMHLKYHPAKLEIVSFLPEFFGWGENTSYYVVQQKWDNEKGTFDLAFTCLGEEGLFTGSGKVGTILFKVKGTTSETLKISRNIVDFGERACMWVDSRGETTKYALSDAMVVNDNTPPGISDVKALSNNAVRITFNEPVDAESAQNLNNYSIFPYISINDVQLDASGTSVTLMTDPQVGNRAYEVSVVNIKDVIGNQISSSLSRKFRGVMKLWLEAECPVYKGNPFTVRLKAGPVERFTKLRYYVKYDEIYLRYQNLSWLNENFTADIKVLTGASGKVFGGTLEVLRAVGTVSYDNDWTICEFGFMPEAITSTYLEFVTNYPAAPLEGYGIFDNTVNPITVDFSNE